jgi:hypothetical protein
MLKRIWISVAALMSPARAKVSAANALPTIVRWMNCLLAFFPQILKKLLTVLSPGLLV